MRSVTMAAFAAILLIGLAACGERPGTRAVTGGLLGAGTGAAVGGLTGAGAGTGALVGGGVGALGGAATAPRR
jgi:osmotically inducible lipoprotein OsmB